MLRFIALYCCCCCCVALTVAVVQCGELTRRKCLRETESCVWKQQGLVKQSFLCENVAQELITIEFPRVASVEKSHGSRAMFTCKRPEISRLHLDACFAQSKYHEVQECGCNSVNEVTYTIPVPNNEAKPAPLNHSVLFQDTIIVFLHVNKAGGTTVKNMLMSTLSQHQWDGAAYGSLEGWKFLSNSLQVSAAASSRTTLQSSPTHTPGDSIMYSQCGNRFSSMQQATDYVFEQGYSLSQAATCPLRIVWGNRAMGLCDLFPNKPCVYFTVIRDPIARALSDYSYFCLEGAENKHKWSADMLQQGKCTMTPSQWFISMRTSPYFLIERLTRGCDPACGVEAAIANLKHPCMRYLILEYFDDGMRKLRDTFGPVFASSIDTYLSERDVKNAGSSRAAENLPAQELANLRTLLKDDLLVYQAAIKHYHKQWQQQQITSCN